MNFELPFPVSVNLYYRSINRGKFCQSIISKRGREYRGLVLGVIAENPPETLTGRLKVIVKLYPPDRRKRDIDNLMKSLLDALTHAEVWEDDSQIDILRISREEIRKGGSAEVTIRML